MTVWTFLAFALDAIAIAAQALTGRSLGAGDVAGTRSLTRRMIQWGVVSGVVSGLALAVLSPVLGHAFTSDTAVLDALVPVLLVAALGQPIAGVVFVLDGVLIGAGDGTYLAWAGLVVLVVYAPLALLAPTLTWLWVAFAFGFMLARAVVLRRARTRRRLAGHRHPRLSPAGTLGCAHARTDDAAAADRHGPGHRRAGHPDALGPAARRARLAAGAGRGGRAAGARPRNAAHLRSGRRRGLGRRLPAAGPRAAGRRRPVAALGRRPARTSPSPSSSPGAWAGWPRRRATVARPAGCGCC